MEKAYKCPFCRNNTLYAIYENDNIYVCDECGVEFTGVETFEGGIKFLKTEFDDVVDTDYISESNDDNIRSKMINVVYADYARELDYEAEEIYKEYTHSYKQIDEILLSRDYLEENGLYVKKISSAVCNVFDLSKLHDTNYIKYYVLFDGEIPSGWTSTKMKVTEDTESSVELNEEKNLSSRISKHIVQYLDENTGWTNYRVYNDKICAQRARLKLNREKLCKTKVFSYNPDIISEDINCIKNTLTRLSESILTKNPIDKVVYGSIRILLEHHLNNQFKVVAYVSDVSFASKDINSIDEGEEILDEIRERLDSLTFGKDGELSYYEYISNFDRVKKYISNKLSVTNESINKNSVTAKSYKDLVNLYEDTNGEEELETAEQKISSANTSINSSKTPAIFNLVNFVPGSLNLDYGGGKFDTATEFLANQNVENLIYDPYNRSAEHNKEVIKRVRENGGADTITLSNVLNVIAEEESRLAVLRNCKKLLKSGGTLYITVYVGTGKGDSKETKAGYQLNRKTTDYIEEISYVFSDVTCKGRLIIAK